MKVLKLTQFSSRAPGEIDPILLPGSESAFRKHLTPQLFLLFFLLLLILVPWLSTVANTSKFACEETCTWMQEAWYVCLHNSGCCASGEGAPCLSELGLQWVTGCRGERVMEGTELALLLSFPPAVAQTRACRKENTSSLDSWNLQLMLCFPHCKAVISFVFS